MLERPLVSTSLNLSWVLFSCLSVLCSVSQRTFPRLLCCLHSWMSLTKGRYWPKIWVQEEETSLPPLSLFSLLCLFIYIYISLAEFVLHLICDSVPPEGLASLVQLPPRILTNAIFFQQLNFTTPSLWLAFSEEEHLPVHANL